MTKMSNSPKPPMCDFCFENSNFGNSALCSSSHIHIVGAGDFLAAFVQKSSTDVRGAHFQCQLERYSIHHIFETYMTFPLKQFLKKRCMRLPGTARVRMVAQVVRRGQGQNET